MRRKVTPEKERGWAPAFLLTLRETGNVRGSCETAGVSRQRVYDHRNHNPNFAQQWADATEDATEKLEAIARMRAMTVSDTLLIFLLKSLRPNVYRERATIEHDGKITIDSGDYERIAGQLARLATPGLIANGNSPATSGDPLTNGRR